MSALKYQRDIQRSLVVGVVLAQCLVSMAGLRAAEVTSVAADFESQILPILSENCFQCHGPDKRQRKAGLRLDQRAAALSVLDSGERALVPGQAEASGLIQRIRTEDPDDRMPPEDSGKSLTAEEIELLAQWVNQGAPYPKHWAYRPLMDPSIPTTSYPGSEHPVDSFVAARLESEGVVPSPEADRHTLIKRLYYDLLGLIPDPDEVAAFVGDRSDSAYDRLVDRLLDSKHFGERWGRHWLDKARYADSDGYEKDNARPNAWRYRDWVINAINQDLPFDVFTMEQLAGDLLPAATDEQRLATAFHRQTLTNTEGGTDREQWRVAAVMDRLETTGSVWLGLTVGCARCHTHKYDAITHEEYYQMYAFFNNGDETTTELVKSPQALRAYQRAYPAYRVKEKALEEAIQEREAALAEGQAEWEAATRKVLEAGGTLDLSDAVKEALGVAVSERNEKQKKTIRTQIQSEDEPLKGLKKSLGELKKTAPASPHLKVRVVTQRLKDARDTRVLERGEFTKPQQAVEPGVLAVLPELVGRQPKQRPDRLDFAQWLIREDNPLPARVAVNHVWANLFGQGLVATRNDFGVRGERPSHPELLDHLARKFMALGWSRKALIRYIVSSATYRRSSDHRPELMDRDPKNQLLARQNRFRVEAEIVRDLYLGVAGLLSSKVGGPSVFPPTSKDVVALTYNSSVKWNLSPGEDRYRRGMYTFFKRTAPHPNLMTFDCPDSNTTCIERNRSNTPLAALATMNNEVFVEAAKAFAQRVLAWDDLDDEDRLTRAFLTATVRLPQPDELASLVELLTEARAHYQANPEDASLWLAKQDGDASEAAELAAWGVCLRVILNLDEVINRS